MKCIKGAWFSIKINGDCHGFFKGQSGVRQGDLLSPFLFVLSMEVLSRILRKNNVSYHPKCASLRINHLIFADDLMIFVRGNLGSIQEVKHSLNLVAEYSGLTANAEKTEIYFGGVNFVQRLHIL